MADELDLEGDAEALAPSREALASVSELVKRQLKYEYELAQAEANLKYWKERLREVQERDLPAALAAAGTSSFTTDDGVEVSIADELHMSIPKARLTETNAWLHANNLGALVVPTITVELKRGQHNERAMVCEYLTENGFSYKIEEKANTASVKAAFRKRLEDGKETPLELFGGYHQKLSVVKLPKG